MEMGIVEMHSWEVEALKLLAQFLILCVILHAVCFGFLHMDLSVLCIINCDSIEKRRNILIFFKIIKEWSSSNCHLWKNDPEKIIEYVLLRKQKKIHVQEQRNFVMRGRRIGVTFLPQSNDENVSQSNTCHS